MMTGSLARADGALPRPVSVLMDEFASSIGRIPDMQVRLNTLRSRRVSILAAIQSLSQLRAVYGEDCDAVLGAFSSKVFFPRLELADAEYASRASGMMTVEAESFDRGGPGAGGGLLEGSPGASRVQPVGRRVLLPDEIASPPRHFALGQPVSCFLVGQRPFQAWLPPAFELAHLAPIVRRAWSSDQVPRALRTDAPTVNRKLRARSRPIAARDSLDVPTRIELAHCKLGELLGDEEAARLLTTLRAAGTGDASGLLRLLEELAEAQTNVADFLDLPRRARTHDPRSLLHYLKYRRARLDSIERRLRGLHPGQGGLFSGDEDEETHDGASGPDGSTPF